MDNAELSQRVDVLLTQMVSLEKTLNNVSMKMEYFEKELDERAEQDTQTRKTLYGNGDNSGGVMGRMKAVETALEGWDWIRKLVVALIAAEVLGYIALVVKTAQQIK